MKAIRLILLAVVLMAGGTKSEAMLLSWNTTSGQTIPDGQPNSGLVSDIYIAPTDSQLTGSGISTPYSASVSSIQFTISGGWAGDYTVSLKYTDGTTSLSSTLISSLQGGLAANSGFTSVTLTSASGFPDIITAGSTSITAAITGTYGVNFSTFNGVAPAGDWLLYVTDNASGDVGVLGGWTLNLQVVPEPSQWGMIAGAGLLGMCGFRVWQQRRKQICN
jgi:hypothetical protein